MKALGFAVLRMVLTSVLAVTFVFFVLRLSGDPVRAFLPADASEELIEQLTRQMGFDRPLHEQYFGYLSRLLQGDFGHSIKDFRPALNLVADKLPMTLMLMGTSLCIALVVGVSGGLLAARYRGTAIDRVVMAFSVAIHSMPNILLGILLILLFAVALRWLPSGGGTTWRHLALPAMVIGLSQAGVYARFVRSSTLEVLSQPFMKVVSLKPLPGWYVARTHVLPGAALPILTLIGFSVGGMIAGAAVVESVFAWPGVGRYLVVSVLQRDVAVVQTIVIFTALTMALTNFITDLLYIALDPRLASGGRAQ